MDDRKQRLMNIADKAMSRTYRDMPTDRSDKAEASEAEASEAEEWEGGGGFKYSKKGDVITVTHPSGKTAKVVKDGQNGQYFDAIMSEYKKMSMDQAMEGRGDNDGARAADNYTPAKMAPEGAEPSQDA